MLGFQLRAISRAVALKKFSILFADDLKPFSHSSEAALTADNLRIAPSNSESLPAANPNGAPRETPIPPAIVPKLTMSHIGDPGPFLRPLILSTLVLVVFFGLDKRMFAAFLLRSAGSDLLTLPNDCLSCRSSITLLFSLIRNRSLDFG